MSIAIMVRKNNGQFQSQIASVNSLGMFLLSSIGSVVVGRLAAVAVDFAAQKLAEKFDPKQPAQEQKNNVVGL